MPVLSILFHSAMLDVGFAFYEIIKFILFGLQNSITFSRFSISLTPPIIKTLEVD